jgi:hypothetical protein
VNSASTVTDRDEFLVECRAGEIARAPGAIDEALAHSRRNEEFGAGPNCSASKVRVIFRRPSLWRENKISAGQHHRSSDEDRPARRPESGPMLIHQAWRGGCGYPFTLQGKSRCRAPRVESQADPEWGTAAVHRRRVARSRSSEGTP